MNPRDSKKTPCLRIPELKLFIEKEVCCYVIDTFEEHYDLLIRVEQGLESLKNSDLPFRSEFDEFVPYLHMESGFKYLKVQFDEDLSAKDKYFKDQEDKKRLLENQRIKESMREQMKQNLQEKYYELLLKAQIINMHIDSKICLSEAVVACGISSAQISVGTAYTSCCDPSLIKEFYKVACLVNTQRCLA